MKTLKSSRNFHGSPISIRALRLLEDRSFPVSLRDLINSDGAHQFQGHIETGDVVCNWEMKVWENGFWTAIGNFVDNGTFAGDFFFLELILDREHSVGVKLEGSIFNPSDGNTLQIRKDGSDRRIRDNWEKILGSGPSARLHAAVAVGDGFVSVLRGLLTASSSDGGAQRCPDDSGDVQTGGACVQVTVGGGDGGGGDGGGD